MASTKWEIRATDGYSIPKRSYVPVEGRCESIIRLTISVLVKKLILQMNRRWKNTRVNAEGSCVCPEDR
jgi:hypothetical protein